jgi:hypothetical protein
MLPLIKVVLLYINYYARIQIKGILLYLYLQEAEQVVQEEEEVALAV